MKQEKTARIINIRGVVQGVGFRPFVYKLARKYDLHGWVLNSSRGVEIEINGDDKKIERLIKEMQQNPPPLARIDTINIKNIKSNGHTHFEIRSSKPVPGEFMPISPDVAICDDCRNELFDPSNPRFRYPFINCTNCGPRFSIINDIPYDRPRTTMHKFKMCSFCQSEYDDPSNRRFHAQPVACPVCGPHVWLEMENEQRAIREDAIQETRQLLKQGKIIAIKGLGGFHLACDATNSDAIEELRRRKNRSDKPLAVMVFNSETAKRYVSLKPSDMKRLKNPYAPILLVDRNEQSLISPLVAPHLNQIGLMLAYTPMHLLLLEPQDGYPEVLVMTSGNISEEPIAYSNKEARERLSGLCDGFLFHNRDINMRIDDSVVNNFHGENYFLRRARGFAPNSISIPMEMPKILAVGAQQKNTICLTRDQYAFVSHHIGELENAETLESFEEAILHYQKLFKINPKWVASDFHPDYLSTKYALNRAQSDQLFHFQIQHHHAHLASCIADNGYAQDANVLGVIFDGTGLGTDGKIWGGEFLIGSMRNFNRFFHLPYTPLPGGDASIQKLYRNCLAQLWQYNIPWDDDLPPVIHAEKAEKDIIHKQLEKEINTPATSSMGRLFDAVSSLIGLRQEITYEAQAAIELEAAVNIFETESYPFEVSENSINLLPFWETIIKDFRQKQSIDTMAARFHNTVVHLVIRCCELMRKISGLNKVALSGGVWQNSILLEKTTQLLLERNFIPLYHHQVPANDGGISLGQAVIASANISD